MISSLKSLLILTALIMLTMALVQSLNGVDNTSLMLFTILNVCTVNLLDHTHG
jgi:hypothetical protein